MKKQLSILIYSLASGGAERVVSILLDELKDKFDVTLVLMNDTLEYEIKKNQKILYLEKSKSNESGIRKLLKLPYLAWRYKALCKANNIEISLSFTSRPNYINILSKILRNNSKVIISERAMPSLQYGYKNLLSIINKQLISTLYKKSDKIIANSHGNAKDLEDNFFVPKRMIDVINNPVNLEMIHESSKQKTDLNFDKYTFITIGRLDIGKNHKMLIDAFSEIEDKNTQLLIIGEGVLKNDLLKQIEGLHLEDRVLLLSRQTNPYMYLSKSDCFVFSSNHEGFPNVLLEALACALPIISTDCQSGPREILAPNHDITTQIKDKVDLVEYGILIPVNNKNRMTEAMNMIINEQSLRDRYKEKAMYRASFFSLDKIIKQYEDVLCVE